ncbi:syntaxin-31 isoform X3 [Juglans microcarpa x Juglans regia]|uniref:syntaxin-31 isoform X3 n=1 Tax=Juglans microcarpa x Juglans regia TaxID=2249226 RepID=UPI001B7DACB4|nr:syntaxin-31 isoform X3 [Juglans microcarpa x Juglans regia]
MSSTYRDRTSEFRSLSQTLKKIGGVTVVNRSENDPSSSEPSVPAPSRSEFNKKASRIGLGIHETSQKIARLAQLAKRSSMFDDPIVEIQELTALIKNDITSLNVALSDLQTIQNIEMADGNYSDDRVVHSTAVCDDLKSKLMGATKQLQDVLTTRTEVRFNKQYFKFDPFVTPNYFFSSQHIKAHENRKQMFSKNALRENPFQHNSKTVTEPLPWSSSSNGAASPQPSALAANGVQVGNQLRRRLAVDNTPSQQMEMSMLQQVVPRQENYTQSRAVALHNVESTISELSGIFTHLATMVAQQGELAIRCKDSPRQPDYFAS